LQFIKGALTIKTFARKQRVNLKETGDRFSLILDLDANDDIKQIYKSPKEQEYWRGCLIVIRLFWYSRMGH
jgi:hypothetical protein